MSKYSEADKIDALNAEQLELMARSEYSILVRYLQDDTSFDAHRVRLLLELGAVEAQRRLDAPSAPMGEELPDLPNFMRRDIERAIEEAARPKGMSVHDGKARIGGDRLQRLLMIADTYAARIRQLERELEERKTVSVDTPEFHELLGKFRSCGIMSTEDMANEIIAYIDGRTAGAAEAWIDVKDELPQPGERVLVSRYAGKVANDAHPGYPDNAWIEVSLIPDRFAGFLCDLTSTGYVTHWKRVAAPTPLGMEEANG